MTARSCCPAAASPSLRLCILISGRSLPRLWGSRRCTPAPSLPSIPRALPLAQAGEPGTDVTAGVPSPVLARLGRSPCPLQSQPAAPVLRGTLSHRASGPLLTARILRSLERHTGLSCQGQMSLRQAGGGPDSVHSWMAFGGTQLLPSHLLRTPHSVLLFTLLPILEKLCVLYHDCPCPWNQSIFWVLVYTALPSKGFSLTSQGVSPRYFASLKKE